MAENFNVFDITFSCEDMERISGLDTGKSLFISSDDPQTVEWFMSIVQISD